MGYIFPTFVSVWAVLKLKALFCFQKTDSWDFPSGPIVKTSSLNSAAVGSILGRDSLQVNDVRFMISEEDLALGPGTSLDRSRAFV